MRDALGFLTLVPGDPDRVTTSRTSLLFFPVVGVLVGLCWALPGLLFGHRFPSAGITAALVLLVDAAVTRGMHLDAVADVADGAASGRRGDEGIAIMRDPTIGAIGAAVLILMCLLRYGALTFSAEFPFRLLAAPVVGRAAMVLLIAWLPALQDGGVAHRLTRPPRWVLAGAAVVTVAAVLASGSRGVSALAAGLGVAVVYGAWLRTRFGELGRDGVGAGCLIAETAALLVLSSN